MRCDLLGQIAAGTTPSAGALVLAVLLTGDGHGSAGAGRPLLDAVQVEDGPASVTAPDLGSAAVYFDSAYGAFVAHAVDVLVDASGDVWGRGGRTAPAPAASTGRPMASARSSRRGLEGGSWGEDWCIGAELGCFFRAGRRPVLFGGVLGLGDATLELAGRDFSGSSKSLGGSTSSPGSAAAIRPAPIAATSSPPGVAVGCRDCRWRVGRRHVVSRRHDCWDDSGRI